MSRTVAATAVAHNEIHGFQSSRVPNLRREVYGVAEDIAAYPAGVSERFEVGKDARDVIANVVTSVQTSPFLGMRGRFTRKAFEAEIQVRDR